MHDRGHDRHDHGAGACQVTASQAGDEDYLPASATETFPSHDHADRDRGGYDPDARATSPAFTVRYTGFVNGEGPSVLGGSLLVSPTATVSATSPGVYVLRASGLTATTYAISYVDGMLTSIYRCLSTIRPPIRERPLHSRSTCATPPGRTCPRPPLP